MHGNTNKYKRSSLEELRLMHEIWTDCDYAPTDFAFRIRALNLARIECKLHALGELPWKEDS